MFTRGVRGATTVANNTKEEILAATQELLAEIIEKNNIEIADIASVVFTTTADLNAEFPAQAARKLGWEDTALLCAREIDVPGSLQKCIRVLLHVNTNKKQSEVVNVYLKEAVNLRR
ncbi:chorismate mutase [candidate division WOR-1 bacterium RIFOXYB2_FULL_42_35]|uniref:chorismate mutase n=1 Tax=candidate division WOR-1 bacterium RIFOXYC2_FULL_41_25 TaxID=1802586 RepID=A0A1F4TMV9_UNCSA|nr:MAG: chorismate mutase [candidate division WOR-1 bacterium RIFOXYA2_FULL_41_14]OGC24322.1 MAG: chorismate mutase [candidate division WOR-1 bacterium RIFOXYB2_FULL_42_35]OGC34024.1 MAG: chorismate mutase [candidate division WOR-1 bacterium RIFOXYC2_FULL_41_25]OGC42339.1 MAG: chorismate mutase [candidate division WOR-1 bacterium RIFOXYD2_FULL_41_8]